MIHMPSSRSARGVCALLTLALLTALASCAGQAAVVSPSHGGAPEVSPSRPVPEAPSVTPSQAVSASQGQPVSPPSSHRF